MPDARDKHRDQQKKTKQRTNPDAVRSQIRALGFKTAAEIVCRSRQWPFSPIVPINADDLQNVLDGNLVPSPDMLASLTVLLRFERPDSLPSGTRLAVSAIQDRIKEREKSTPRDLAELSQAAAYREGCEIDEPVIKLAIDGEELDPDTASKLARVLDVPLGDLLESKRRPRKWRTNAKAIEQIMLDRGLNTANAIATRSRKWPFTGIVPFDVDALTSLLNGTKAPSSDLLASLAVLLGFETPEALDVSDDQVIEKIQRHKASREEWTSEFLAQLSHSPVYKSGCSVDRLTVARVIDGRGAELPQVNKIARILGVTPEDILLGEEPYIGLQSFTSNDQEFFAGRSVIAQQIADRVSTTPLVSILGVSGSGKSSLISAGVLPRLISSPWADWRIVTMTPSEEPIRNLLQGFKKQFKDFELRDERRDPNATGPEDLEANLAEWRAAITRCITGSAKILIVVDQWEQLYAKDVPKTSHEAFSNLLCDLASSDHVQVLLACRADFFGELTNESEAFQKLESAGRVALPRMTEHELREAIETPAMRAHYKFEPDLVNLILRDLQSLGKEGKVDTGSVLPLLQIALSDLWGHRDKQYRTITLSAYQKTNGVADSISRYADQRFAMLDPGSQSSALSILTSLVQRTESGRLLSRPRARSFFSPEELRVLQDLTDAWLVKTETADEPSNSSYTIAHEALAREWTQLKSIIERDPPFREWLEIATKQYEIYSSNGANTEDLLTGWGLDFAEGWFRSAPDADNVDQIEIRHEAASFANKVRDRVLDFLRLSLLHKRRLENKELQQRIALETIEKERRQTELLAAQERTAAALKIARRTTVGIIVASLFALSTAVAGLLAYLNQREAERTLAAALTVSDGLVNRIAEKFEGKGLPASVSVEILDEALDLQLKLLGDKQLSPTNQLRRISAERQFAFEISKIGEPDRAKQQLFKNLEQINALLIKYPEKRGLWYEKLEIVIALSQIPYLEDSQKIVDGIFAELPNLEVKWPADPRIDLYVASLLVSRGTLLMESNPEQALIDLNRALDISKREYVSQNEKTESEIVLMGAIFYLYQFYFSENPRRALEIVDEGIDIATRIMIHGEVKELAQQQLARFYSDRSKLVYWDDQAKAFSDIDRAIDLMKELILRDPNNLEYRKAISDYKFGRGMYWYTRGQEHGNERLFDARNEVLYVLEKNKNDVAARVFLSNILEKLALNVEYHDAATAANLQVEDVQNILKILKQRPDLENYYEFLRPRLEETARRFDRNVDRLGVEEELALYETHIDTFREIVEQWPQRYRFKHRLVVALAERSRYILDRAFAIYLAYTRSRTGETKGRNSEISAALGDLLEAFDHASSLDLETQENRVLALEFSHALQRQGAVLRSFDPDLEVRVLAKRLELLESVAKAETTTREEMSDLIDLLHVSGSKGIVILEMEYLRAAYETASLAVSRFGSQDLENELKTTRNAFVSALEKQAYEYLLDSDFGAAETAIRESILLSPDDFSQPVVRQHLVLSYALMFQDLIAAAEEVHRDFEGKEAYDNVNWQQAVISHFENFEEIGLTHPFMMEYRARYPRVKGLLGSEDRSGKKSSNSE